MGDVGILRGHVQCEDIHAVLCLNGKQRLQYLLGSLWLESKISSPGKLPHWAWTPTFCSTYQLQLGLDGTNVPRQRQSRMQQSPCS